MYHLPPKKKTFLNQIVSMSLSGFFIARVDRSLRAVSGLLSNGYWGLLPALETTGVEPGWTGADKEAVPLQLGSI